MKKYIGTKTIEAIACTLGEFILQTGRNPYQGNNNEYAKHKDSEEGYKVKYEDGYVSWSPKDVFEKAYKPCGSFLDRLTLELQELQEKQNKLNAFFSTPIYKSLDEQQQKLLEAQFGAMLAYSSILIARRNLLLNTSNK